MGGGQSFKFVIYDCTVWKFQVSGRFFSGAPPSSTPAQSRSRAIAVASGAFSSVLLVLHLVGKLVRSSLGPTVPPLSS